jgi:hypothetical protein
MHNKLRSGGKPPFPTFETFKPESLSLNYLHLTGQEGLLCLRSTEINLNLILFCNLVLYYGALSF